MLLSISFSLILLSLLRSFVVCPNPSFQNRLYTFLEKGGTWNKSRDHCRSQGGDLVSIETEDERNFIKKEIQKSNDTFYHIGLEKKAGNWTWVSGKPLTLNKWKENQPSDVGDVAFISEVVLNGSKRGLLQVTQRAQSHASICEISKGKTITHLSKLGACANPLNVKRCYQTLFR